MSYEKVALPIPPKIKADKMYVDPDDEVNIERHTDIKYLEKERVMFTVTNVGRGHGTEQSMAEVELAARKIVDSIGDSVKDVLMENPHLVEQFFEYNIKTQSYDLAGRVCIMSREWQWPDELTP